MPIAETPWALGDMEAHNNCRAPKWCPVLCVWVNIKATKELCLNLCICLKTKCMRIVRPTNERESHMDTQQQHIAMTPTSHPTHAPSPSKKYYFTSKCSEDFPCK